MHKRILSDPQSLKVFQSRTAEYIDVQLPMEYLQRSRVIGYYNKENVLCGGYVFVTEGPFRVIDSIPREQKNNLKKFYYTVNEEQVCEVTGLWFSSKLYKKKCSFRFWISFIKEALALDRKYFVYLLPGLIG